MIAIVVACRKGFFLATLFFAVGLSLFFVATGCQSVQSRWRGGEIDASAEDDWAPPNVRNYPNSTLHSRRTAAGASPATDIQGSQDSDSARNPAVSSTKVKMTDSTPPSRAVTANVGSTSEKSTPAPEASLSPSTVSKTEASEVDVEGAIASLPPDFQELAKRQLLAIQGRKQGADDNEMAVDTTPSRSSKISAKLSDVSFEPEQNALKPAVSETADRDDVVQASSVNADGNPVENAVAYENSVTSAASPNKLASIAVEPAPELSWKGMLNESITKLEKQLSENPAMDANLRLSQEMSLRWMHLANRQLDKAAAPIEGLSPHEKDYLRHQVVALYEASNPDAIPIPGKRWSLVMNSQRQATSELAAIANLEIRTVAFCNEVQGYGVITKFPKYTFTPEQQLLLYCEVDNVSAEKVKSGFETQLQGTYEILDQQGKSVLSQLLPPEKEICQNHRRDYFIIYEIAMPTQIDSGKYQMRVTVEDLKAKKYGQSQLAFEIQ